MDITNLMIGDWVYEIPYNNQSTKNITTVDIGILMNIAGATFFKEDYEPIPITDELLNSLFGIQDAWITWSIDDDGLVWIGNDGLVWIAKDDDDKYRLVVYGDDEEDSTLRTNATVEYLHNIQHLLKEVGKADLLDKIKF